MYKYVGICALCLLLYMYVGMYQAWQACGTLAPSKTPEGTEYRGPIKLTFSVGGRDACMLQMPRSLLCFDTATPAVERVQPAWVVDGRPIYYLLYLPLRHIHVEASSPIGWCGSAIWPSDSRCPMATGWNFALFMGKTTALSAVVPITHGGSRVAPEQPPATLALHHHLIDVERNTICHRPERNTQRP